MNFSTQLNLLTPNNSAKKVNEPVKNKNYRQYQNAPEKDSLKISSQENKPKEKTGLVKKWGKIAAMVGGGIALLTGTLIAKKKLDIKNAKKLQEEARKKSVEIAQKARAEQLKREEEARIAAQKAFEEKAQRRLEEKAKLKAEQEAKLKAQKEAEAQKAAQLAAEKAYQKKVKNISDSFFQKFGAGGTINVDSDMSNTISKKEGIYKTIYFEDVTDEVNFNNLLNATIKALKDLFNSINIKDNASVLIVGLGNRKATPDALGPLTIDSIKITRQIVELGLPLDSKYRVISSIVPGVMGTTGIETKEIIEGVIEKTKPDFLIVIDALAA